MPSLLFFNYFARLFFQFIKILLFSQKLGAVRRNAGRNRIYLGEYADFDIPLRSQVYVRTPYDCVFVNTLPFRNQNQAPN